MADGEVKIEITADDSDIKKKLDGVEDKAEDAAEKLEDLGDSAKDSGKGFGIADVAIGNFISNGVTALIGKVGEAVSSLIALADETREYREDMAKLTSAFKTAGHSTEVAQKAYDGFYKLLGESDRSVEAVNHLAELTTNTEELAQWQTIAAGVTAKFGDSLPIEGLTEAANETAKVGAVTGPLADALNWAGISEDEFNKKLEACNSEQERATLITSTLSAEYQAAATEYNTLTASTQAAREATNRMEQAQAELGASIEPLTTWWTNAKASMLSWAGEGVSSVLQGMENIKAGTVLYSESQRALVNEIDAQAQAYRDTKTAAAELATAQMADVDYATTTLLPQLQELYDSNGLVKQGYEARAEFIMGRLNEALGTEYTKISEIIDANGQLTQSIQDAIVAKQAQILLEQYEAGYTEAIQKKAAAEETHRKTLAELVAQEEVVKTKEQELKALRAEIQEASLKGDMETVRSKGDAVKNLQISYDKESEILKGLQTKYNESDATIQGYYEDIAAYQKAQTLIMEGKTEEAVSYLESLNAGYETSTSKIKDATDEQKAAAEKRVEDAARAYKQLLQDYETNEDALTETEKAAAKERIEAAKQEVIDASTEAYNLGVGMVEGIGNGVDVTADWLSGKFKTVVRDAINAGIAEAKVNSPSKVTRDKIGKPLTEGVAVGVESEQKTLNKAMEGAIEGAVEAGQDYAGIHSPASLTRDKIGIWLVPGIAEGVEQTSDVLINALNGVFDKMVTYLNEESKKQIKTITQYNADKEAEYKAHADALKQIERDKNKEISALNEKLAEDKKKKDADVVKLEKEYNKDLADIHKKAFDSEQRQYQQHGNNIRAIDANIRKSVSDRMTELLTLESNYQTNVKKIWADLDQSIKDLNNSYDEQLKSRTESIASSLNLWNAAEKNKVSGAQLEKNLKSQVKVLKNYNDAIADLEGRGINENFIQQLKEMGVGATGEIEALSKMTDDELADYVKLWEEKNALAKSAAIEELEPLKEETEQQIRDLSDKALEEYHRLTENYKEQSVILVEELKTAMSESGLAGYEEIMAQVDDYTLAGVSLMDGIIVGIVEESPYLQQAVAEAVERAIAKGEAIAGISIPVHTDDTFSLEDYMSNLGGQITNAVNSENSKIASGGTSRSTVDAELASAIGQNNANLGSLASAFNGQTKAAVTVPINIDGREFGRAVVEFGTTEANRTGTSLAFT